MRNVCLVDVKRVFKRATTRYRYRVNTYVEDKGKT